MDFGPDPFAPPRYNAKKSVDTVPDQQLEDDMDVLNEIENDLGASYLAERVGTQTKNKSFNPLHGQSFQRNNNNNIMIDDDCDDDDDINNINKPLRKRKRSYIDNEDFMDLSILPNPKRMKVSNINNNTDADGDTDADIIVDIDTDIDSCSLYLHQSPSINDNTSLMITNDIDSEKLYIYYDTELTYARDISKCLKELKHNISLNKSDLLQNGKSINELLNEIENDKLNREIIELNQNFLNFDDKYKKDQQLWVDKYKPNSMIDLLSSQKINREVTSWVKQWDYIVFGHKYRRSLHQNNNKYVNQKKNININIKSKSYSFRNNLSIFSQKQNIQKNQFKFKNNNNNNNKKRPDIQVVLFCGAPGTGKTTLAHIVANHCGYRAVEINASDDRNGKKLKEKIVNICNYKPMFGDKRPPLIIMDEIDGALNSNGDSKSAIDAIISIVKESKKYYNNKYQKKKKKNNSNIINRPIICICNNLYAKSLRPLREVAKIYKFRPILTSVLCNRLLDICRKEYLYTNKKTLKYLTSITNNDIRSCLHTLQFFKKKAGGGSRVSNRLNIDSLTNVPIGRKDITYNLFDIWNKILKKRKKTNNYNNNQNGNGNIKKEWKDIQNMMFALKQNNKVLDGIIENYLNLGYIDPLNDIVSSTAELISIFDILSNKIMKNQQFTLMKYIPFVSISIHQVCSTDTFQRLSYPVQSYKQSVAIKENMNIIHTFLNAEPNANKYIKKNNNAYDDDNMFDVCKYSSILGRYFDIKSCILELIPLLPYILFSSNNFHDHNSNYNNNNNNIDSYQKRLNVSTINTMIECGLNYIINDSSNNNYYELTPPIHTLSVYAFKNKERYEKEIKYNFLTNNTKKQISYLIGIEIMRRNESGMNKYKESNNYNNNNNSDNDDRKSIENSIDLNNRMTPFFNSTKKTIKKINRSKQLLTPFGNGQFGQNNKYLRQTQQQTPLKNLFGNKENNKNQINWITEHSRRNTKINKYEYPLQYKFVEGYTNAVKRKSFIRDWI